MIPDLPSNKWCIVLHLRVYCAQEESVVATTAELHQTGSFHFHLSKLKITYTVLSVSWPCSPLAGHVRVRFHDDLTAATSL